MNIKQIMHGEFFLADYKQYDQNTKEFYSPKKFRYKTYDDSQYFERRYQITAGSLSSKHSLSIKTTSSLPFKNGDKITTDADGRSYEITGVQKLYDTPNAILNTLFPRAKGNIPTILHLNKDDV